MREDILRISFSVLFFFLFLMIDGKICGFIHKKMPLPEMDAADTRKYRTMDSFFMGAIVTIGCLMVYKINLWMVAIIIGAFLFREYRKWRK